METPFDPAQLQAALAMVLGWLRLNVLSLQALVQLAVVVLTGALAAMAAPGLRRLGGVLATRLPGLGRLAGLGRMLSVLMLPGAWLVLLLIAEAAARRLEVPGHILVIAVSLVAVWLVIRFAAGFVTDPFWARAVAVAAWTVAALNIVGLLDAVVAVLDGIALPLGAFRLSLLLLVKGLIAFAVLLWLAMTLSRVAQKRVDGLHHLTPSTRVLVGKALHVGLIAAAILIALNAVGIDLTALTVVGGAIGLGLGFGLQKVVSNLVSGVILLMDRSVKPGDVIAVAGTYGRVNGIGARYVSVVTRDGIEHLIPNEELITTRVENWSYSDTKVRLRIPIGIAYEADPHRAIAVCTDAAKSIPRVLASPAPRCLLRNFGDNSVNLELRVWIIDPEDGVANVTSEILLAVWDALKAEGIGIPFPQRTLHLAESPLTVRVDRS